MSTAAGYARVHGNETKDAGAVEATDHGVAAERADG